MGAAPGDTGFDDICAAIWTRLAFAAKNPGEFQIAAFVALSVNVIAIARAAVLETDSQTIDDGLVQAPEFERANICYFCLGVNAGRVQALVGVNIANAG